MLVTKVLYNINDVDNSVGEFDKVLLENESLAKRLHHLKTENDVEVAIHLSEGEHLRVGDVLYQDDDRTIVVDVLPEDVLAIKAKTIKEMGAIAHELGNRHLPAQFIDDVMLVQYDHLVEELLQKHHVNYEHTSVKLPHPFMHVGHKHVY